MTKNVFDRCMFHRRFSSYISYHSGLISKVTNLRIDDTERIIFICVFRIYNMQSYLLYNDFLKYQNIFLILTRF